MTRPPLAEFYGRQVASPAHGDHWAGPPEMVERIAGLLGTRPHQRVLDVGCGVGGPARRLARLVECQVVALDLVPSVLSAAKADTPAGGGPPAPCFAAGSACSLPFGPSSFDQLWCLGVLAHLGQPAGFAEEADRVLAPGGVVAVTEAFWDGWRAPRFLATAPRPWEPLTVAGLFRALSAAGFGPPDELPWPGERSSTTGDEGLDADLLDGRLASRLVIARKT